MNNDSSFILKIIICAIVLSAGLWFVFNSSDARNTLYSEAPSISERMYNNITKEHAKYVNCKYVPVEESIDKYVCTVIGNQTLKFECSNSAFNDVTFCEID